MKDQSLVYLHNITRRLEQLETREMGHGVYLLTPLTSTAWDGDARSTTAKTLIDLSAVFGVPAGVKAAKCHFSCRDSGSAASTNCWFALAPNNTANSITAVIRLEGAPNDVIRETTAEIPCNADGDLYFQCVATGAGTLDVWIEIWGYVL